MVNRRLQPLLLAPLGAVAAHVLGYRAATAFTYAAEHTGHTHLSGLAVVAVALAVLGLTLAGERRSAGSANKPGGIKRCSWYDLVVWQSALFLALELVEAGLGLNAVPAVAVLLALLAQVVTAWWLNRLVSMVSRPAHQPEQAAPPLLAWQHAHTDSIRLVGTRVVATPRLLRAPPAHLVL